MYIVLYAQLDFHHRKRFCSIGTYQSPHTQATNIVPAFLCSGASCRTELSLTFVGLMLRFGIDIPCPWGLAAAGGTGNAMGAACVGLCHGRRRGIDKKTWRECVRAMFFIVFSVRKVGSGGEFGRRVRGYRRLFPRASSSYRC